MGRPIISIDSCVFIYVWERHSEFLKKSKKILNDIYAGRATGIFAEIGLIEVLTGPKKQGRISLATLYKHRIKNFRNLQTAKLNDNSLELASDLRAKYGFRTPDAVHLATAIEAGASVFYTNDKNLKKIKEIKVQTL